MSNPSPRIALLRLAPGLVVVASMGLAASPGTPSALERDPSGWTDLLAGAGPELKGWTRLPVKPTGKLETGTQWSLDPSTGVLTCRGDGGHDWLRSDAERGDFIYHIEWKFTPVPAGCTFRDFMHSDPEQRRHRGDRVSGWLGVCIAQALSSPAAAVSHLASSLPCSKPQLNCSTFDFTA